MYNFDKYWVLIWFCFGMCDMAANALAANMEKPAVFVDVYAAAGRTVLVTPQKKVLLDYERRRISVRDHDGECRWYDLAAPGPVGAGGTSGEIFSRRKDLLGEVRRLDETRSVDPARNQEMVILEFGGQLNRMRTVVQLPLVRFGMEFLPHHEKLWVDRSHPQYAELARIAADNEPFYASEPMLRQIDVLGLLGLAGGVVAGREWSGAGQVEHYRYILQQYEFTFDQCRQEDAWR